MDNITMEKIWIDDDFYSVKITCHNDYVTVFGKCYIQDDEIDNFVKKCSDYMQGKISHFECCFGDVEGQTSSGAVFCVNEADKHGHLKMNVSMVVFNYPDVDKCDLVIRTELGLLCTFGSQLSKIKEPVVGTVISLIE